MLPFPYISRISMIIINECTSNTIVAKVKMCKKEDGTIEYYCPDSNPKLLKLKLEGAKRSNSERFKLGN